jgi:Tol biopolymer transport system component
VRGGAKNSDGYTPNPASDPDGPSPEVWIIRTDGQRLRSLGPGSAPGFAPDGRQLAFLRKGAVQAIDRGDLDDAETLFEVRRGEGSLKWSPEGGRIAFVSARGRNSFIGV